MKITDQTNDSVTLRSDVSTPRAIILGATMVAMVITIAGMAMDMTPLVLVGAACVLALYLAFIFGLETVHATLDLVDGTAEVERVRRGQAVARAILPLERVLPAPGTPDPAHALVQNLNRAASTWASRFSPAPGMAPTDARRIMAWAANA